MSHKYSDVYSSAQSSSAGLLDEQVNIHSTANIHPTAIVEEGAKIGAHVLIEPYTVIKKNVVLKEGVIIKAHVYLDGNTTVGEGTTIWPFASIGTQTQDLKYRGETTYVSIGRGCNIREYVTINSSSIEGSTVKVGDHCHIMAYCHVAHDCEIGDHVIMANGATLAGYVTIEDFAVIGGLTAIHQFCRVGRYAMVGGHSAIGRDVPPFTLGRGDPFKLGGLNLVGLKRHQFSLEERCRLSEAFKLTFRCGLSLEEALSRVEQEVEQIPQVKEWVAFCRNSKRGVVVVSGEEEREGGLEEN